MVIDADVIFNDTVGDSNALESLEILGDTIINGGSITTEGDQNFRGKVFLANDTSFQGEEINFEGDLDGGGNALGLNGNTSFQALISVWKTIKFSQMIPLPLLEILVSKGRST